jgi:hypothetical protein
LLFANGLNWRTDILVKGNTRDGPQQIIRIGAGGVIQTVGLLPNGDWYAGDVTPNGHYWIAAPGGGTTVFAWAEIDADPASATWGYVHGVH